MTTTIVVYVCTLSLTLQNANIVLYYTTEMFPICQGVDVYYMHGLVFTQVILLCLQHLK